MLKSAAALMGVLLALSPQAQGIQEEEKSVFGEILEVRGVDLELVVTDSKGQRVSGLRPEDFRLRVDGDNMTIDFFSEILEGKAVSSAEPSRLTSAPGVEEGESIGTSYLVFIDEYFPKARDRNNALDGLLDGLHRMGPRDRMAIAAFNGQRLKMLTTWEQSPAELRQVIESAKLRPAAAYLFQNDSRYRSDPVEALSLPEEAVARDLPEEQGNNEDGFPEISFDESSVRKYLREMERSLERVATAVQATMRSFANPPGRKVMLLLSGGWPQSPLEYRFTPIEPMIQSGPEKGPKILRRIHETANLIGYTLYPVDVPGRRGAPSAEGFGFPSDSRRALAEGELHTSLEILAKQTGGKAMLDGASLAAFDSAVDDTRSFYWLGFSPQWEGNDSQHKIQLEVLKPGLRVRHRKGFQDLSIRKEVSFQVESALFLGQVPGSEPLQASFGPFGKSRRGRFQVPMTLTIPMDSVIMIPSGDQFVAELELRVSVLDESGDRNEMPVIPVRLAGPEAPQPGQHATYETAIKLRNESHDLIVALYQPASGRLLSTVKRVTKY
ncbi:MAG: VWA domain-containing protein [Deltaproteobacteria bacterium]|nr:VWA domain-containing protein [Deltaproteobacteria bacterium]